MSAGPDEPLVDAGRRRRRVLERALAHGGDFAELFCEDRRGFTLSIDESRIERPQSGSERGAGIRVIDGEVTRFAHVDGLGRGRPDARGRGLAGALAGNATEPVALRAAAPPELQEIEVDPASVPAERKAEVLRELDERARSAGSEVAQASASYSEGRRRVAVFNSEGLQASDDRTRVRLGVQVVARRNGSVETGFETLGEHRGFELLDGDPARIADQAAQKAITLLGADPAPAGEMTVVVGGGFGGVLFHEMTGHGLEADAVQKGASVYANRMGEKVAEPLLNAYDDGTHAARVGDRGDRRRGHAEPQDRGDRGGPPDLLPLRPPARPPRRDASRPATAAGRASGTCRSRA